MSRLEKRERRSLLAENLRELATRFVLFRRDVRKRVNQKQRLDRFLHLFSCIVMATNIVFIMYALVSIIGRSATSGVPLIDSLPLAFYVLPLMVILPKILLDLYRTRSAILNLIILVISAAVFGLISSLIHGFTVLVFLNVTAAIIIFIIGRFRPTQQISSIGRKGCAWFFVMNVLGLMLPISVIVMGQSPIATVVNNQDAALYLEMPLASFEYNYTGIAPSSVLLDNLRDSSMGIDLQCLSNSTVSLTRLETWITALNPANIPYRITVSSDRDAIGRWIESQSDSELTVFDVMAGEYATLLGAIHNITDSHGIQSSTLHVYLDMTLSLNEWGSLMKYVRDVNLPEFSTYLRNSIDQLPSDHLLNDYLTMTERAKALGFNYSFVVDGFVVDDVIDGDSVIAKLDGFSTSIFQGYNPTFEVSCSRTRYSEAMAGDVGEYLAYSYSLSDYAGSMRLGIAGNRSGTDRILSPVYSNLITLATDIAIASGNGVTEIVVGTLPSILSSFGNDSLLSLRSELQSIYECQVTYTFRIYAFRAVVVAIDAFDFIMF
jgi:hypothetical protein